MEDPCLADEVTGGDARQGGVGGKVISQSHGGCSRRERERGQRRSSRRVRSEVEEEPILVFFIFLVDYFGVGRLDRLDEIVLLRQFGNDGTGLNWNYWGGGNVDFVAELGELTSSAASGSSGGLVGEERHLEAGSTVDHLGSDRRGEDVRRQRRRLGQPDVDVGEAVEEESGVTVFHLERCPALWDYLRASFGSGRVLLEQLTESQVTCRMGAGA